MYEVTVVLQERTLWEEENGQIDLRSTTQLSGRMLVCKLYKKKLKSYFCIFQLRNFNVFL